MTKTRKSNEPESKRKLPHLGIPVVKNSSSSTLCATIFFWLTTRRDITPAGKLVLKSLLKQLMRALTKEDKNRYRRLLAWMRDRNRKPANLAFTAGSERQIAYTFEEVSRK